MKAQDAQWDLTKKLLNAEGVNDALRETERIISRLRDKANKEA